MNGTEATEALPFSRRASDWVVRLLRDVGFPIAVSAYLLLGLGPKIDRLSGLVERLVIVTEARR